MAPKLCMINAFPVLGRGEIPKDLHLGHFVWGTNTGNIKMQGKMTSGDVHK